MNMILTYNGETHDEGPEACPWMTLGGSPDTLVVFLILAVKGIIHEILILQDLGALHLGMLDLDRAVIVCFFGG
jgi:hypothetical protein